MSRDAERESRVRLGLLAVACSSLLMLGYLLFCALAPDGTHAGEGPPGPGAGQPGTGEASQETAMVQQAPWIRNREPVPAWALYPSSDDKACQAPQPAEEAKHQEWWNKILFPTSHCPYCGRRVPTGKGSYLWLIIGFCGQAIFSLRFLVQWLASERARASVIPVSFWHLSIFGSLLLLVYAISIVAWPIILGQAPNVLIYGRNLYFIKKSRQGKPLADR